MTQHSPFGSGAKASGQSRAGTAERLCWHRSTEDRIISCSSYRPWAAVLRLRGMVGAGSLSGESYDIFLRPA